MDLIVAVPEFTIYCIRNTSCTEMYPVDTSQLMATCMFEVTHMRKGSCVYFVRVCRKN